MSVSFNKLSYAHDNIAKPFVVKKLKSYGYYDIIGQGHENDISLLGGSPSTTNLGLRVRFRPDLAVVGGGEFYVEIKTRLPDTKSSNWSMQVESFWACLQEEKCVVLFIDILDIPNSKIGVCQCCFAKDLKLYAGYKWKFFLPPKSYDKEQLIESNFHGCRKERTGENRGSGTPYFLIPQNFTKLQEMTVFFDNFGKRKGLII